MTRQNPTIHGNPADPSKYINMELTKDSRRFPGLCIRCGQYDPNKDWFFTTLNKILTEDFIRVYEADNCSLYQNKLAKPN